MKEKEKLVVEWDGTSYDDHHLCYAKL